MTNVRTDKIIYQDQKSKQEGSLQNLVSENG